ncbi:unnamed protein product [Lota lota]
MEMKLRFCEYPNFTVKKKLRTVQLALTFTVQFSLRKASILGVGVYKTLSTESFHLVQQRAEACPKVY